MADICRSSMIFAQLLWSGIRSRRPSFAEISNFTGLRSRSLPLVFSLFWWSPFHISVTLIPVQRSQQNWKVRQLASDGRWWGERDGGINVGYKPLITSWESPQCPPSPASYPTRWTVPTLCRGRQNMIAIKFPKSLALASRLFCSCSLLNRRGETSDWLVIITSDWVVMDPGLANVLEAPSYSRLPLSASVWTP